VERVGDRIVFRVRADGFLYHMVRIMAGTLAAVAAGRIDPAELPALIAAGDRRKMGVTAPACGLYLNRVFYPQKT
jgi:tRNA pseudouridine38-40 synthase